MVGDASQSRRWHGHLIQSDVAVGDIVLVRSDPRDVPRIGVVEGDLSEMLRNLWWAAGTTSCDPLAAGALAAWIHGNAT
jgi:Cu2+-exporting ATPase